jgi:hypothetical protein
MAFGKCSSRFLVASFVLLMAAMRCAQAQEAPVLRDIRDPNPYATRVVDPEVEAYFKQKAINDQKVSRCFVCSCVNNISERS